MHNAPKNNEFKCTGLKKKGKNRNYFSVQFTTGIMYYNNENKHCPIIKKNVMQCLQAVATYINVCNFPCSVFSRLVHQHYHCDLDPKVVASLRNISDPYVKN